MKQKLPFRKSISALFIIITGFVLIILGISVVKANIIQLKRDILARADVFFESFVDYPQDEASHDGFAKTIPVLVYHGINVKTDKYTMTKDKFREQMTSLYSSGYRTVSAEDFMLFMEGKKKLPIHSFLLTFDDGRKDSYYEATPILKRLNFTAVMFVAPSQSLEPANLLSEYYLNKIEIKEMQDSGIWDIQSHALQTSGGFISIDSQGKQEYFLSNKKWLADQSRLESDQEYDVRIEHEIVSAAKIIEKILGNKVSLMSYPFSDFGQHSVNNKQNAVKEINKYVKGTYSFAFMQQWPIDAGFIGNHPTDDPFRLRRIEPASDWSGDHLSQFMLSGEDILPVKFGSGLSLKNMSGRWRKVWGNIELQSNNNVILKTKSDVPSTLALLDGTRAWENYRFDAEIKYEGNGSIGIYGNLNGKDDGVRCVWDKKNLILEQVIDRKTSIRQIFPARNNNGVHIYSIISKDGVVACLEDEVLVGALTLGGKAIGGVGVELHSSDSISSLEIINIGVTFNPKFDVETLKKEATKSIRPLTQITSLPFLQSRLATDYTNIRNYDENINVVLEPIQFSKEMWGGDNAVFSSDQNSYSINLTRHVSGEAYWQWPTVVAQANEYEIQALYTASVPTELKIRSELSNGTIVWSTVREMPAVPTSTKYSFSIELPKDTVRFSVFQAINSVGTLKVESPKLQALKDGNFDKGYVTLSFDDGYLTFKTSALPVLKKHNVPATLAIITSHTAFDRYMSPSDLYDLANSGFEIADHTRNHAHLDASATLENLLQEITGSKYDLEMSGFEPKVFVYPYGSFSLEAVSIIQKSGFVGARTTIRGFNTKNTDRFILKDQIIERATSMADIEEYIRTASNDKKWLILELHNVYEKDNQNDAESITVEKLDAILELIKKYNLEVITLDSGLQKMAGSQTNGI